MIPEHKHPSSSSCCCGASLLACVVMRRRGQLLTLRLTPAPIRATAIACPQSEGPYEAISQFSADYLASLETEAEVMNALGMGDGPPGSKQGSSGSHEGSNMWGMPSGSAMLLAHAASNAPPKPRSSVPGSVTTMAMSPRRSSLPSDSFLPPLRTGSGSFDTTGRKLSHTSMAESLPSPKSLADFKPPVSRYAAEGEAHKARLGRTDAALTDVCCGCCCLSQLTG